MRVRRSRNVATAAALALVGAVAGAGTATANDVFTSEFPAGVACAFPLRVEGTGGNTIVRTFEDKQGNTVRLLTGTGSALTFTNLATQATLSLPSNGAMARTTFLPDGTATIVGGGHNVVFLFPTDVPPGPSTTLYTGRFVVTVDAHGDWTLQTSHGTSRDLCAELSG